MQESCITDRYTFADPDLFIKIEILVADEHVSKVIAIIRKNAHTGYRGDGMIILSPVEEVYKVRTDEQGTLAM
ncbi:MAG: P-II family nitrogen regulator [Bacteroidales bacterium]